MELLEYLRSENQALKVAVYDTAHTLAMTTGALEKGMPHAATALAAAMAEDEAAGGEATSAVGVPGQAHSHSAGGGSSSSAASGDMEPGH